MKIITDGHNYLIDYNCKKCNKRFVSSSNSKQHNQICSSCSNKLIFSKKVSLKHYSSNKTEKCNSITDFCKRHPELGANAKYHLAEVLNGKRIHYKGWYPANKNYKINLNKIGKIEQIYLKQAIT